MSPEKNRSIQQTLTAKDWRLIETIAFVTRRHANQSDQQTRICHFCVSAYLFIMMKPCLLAIALLTPALLWSANSKIELGQTLEQTIEALGKPVGIIELRDRTLLLYPQGEVTLRDDKVSNIDLMSDEQFAADQERLRLEREDWLIQQEKLSAARLKEGEDLKAYKKQSSTFAALPANDRVDYWRSFQIRFPELDVSSEIARALEGYAVELTELKTQHKIAELETRVALAEQQAAAARLETEKLRNETAALSRSNFGLRSYTTPYNNYYYRPPTITIYPNKNKVTHYNHNNLDRWKWNEYTLPNQRSESTVERISRILNTN
jgi:hypothetical protein